ncbi:hypothetical protein AHAS_Ahas11G0052600 [Arachis hypogaea]
MTLIRHLASSTSGGRHTPAARVSLLVRAGTTAHMIGRCWLESRRWLLQGSLRCRGWGRENSVHNRKVLVGVAAMVAARVAAVPREERT